MRKTSISLALVVLLLSLLLAPHAAAQGQTVYVNLLFGSVYHVTTEDTVVLTTGWLACGRGLVRAFIRASNYEVYLDGAADPFIAPEDVDDLWGPIQSTSHLDCPQPDPDAEFHPVPDSAGVARWEYDMGQLAAGQHELHTLMWTDHPLTDGLDSDGDGRPEVQVWTADNTLTIFVTEP